jgi:hypothetical protein
MKQLLLLFFSIAAFSQKPEPFDSNALGESREITIALPASFEKIPQKISTYFTGLLVQSVLWSTILCAYWDDLPEMIIVGISQNKITNI